MELKIKERKKINILSYELCRTKRKDRRMERTKRTEKRERGGKCSFEILPRKEREKGGKRKYIETESEGGNEG